MDSIDSDLHTEAIRLTRSPRRGDLVIPLLTVLVDAFAIQLSFLLSYWLRFHSSVFSLFGFGPADVPPIAGYWKGSFVVTLVWLMLFHARKMYRARRSVSLIEELLNVIRIGSIGMLIVMSAAFFYRDFSYSRIVFGLIWVSAISTIFLGRAVVASVERKLHRRGFNLKSAVIIGGESLANEIVTRLNGHPSFGFKMIAYFADNPAHEELALSTLHYGGPITGSAEFVRQENIETVFIALRSKDQPKLFELISDCEGINVEFMMIPDVLDILTSQVTLRELEGIPLLTLKRNPLTFWGRTTKRAMDILLSAFLLVTLSPVLLVVALLVKLSSKGPVLFKQVRVGIDGVQFTMAKFRSMRLDAEAATGPVWAKERDPRRTPIGIFLRKFSLDELPQLLNVLKGEMSLVGPRPERPMFVDQFKRLVPKYLDRHRVKTGMTGWAQVNGLRGDTSLERRIKFDLYYIENWSIGFDIRILLMTVRAALRVKEVH